MMLPSCPPLAEAHQGQLAQHPHDEGHLEGQAWQPRAHVEDGLSGHLSGHLTGHLSQVLPPIVLEGFVAMSLEWSPQQLLMIEVERQQDSSSMR